MGAKFIIMKRVLIYILIFFSSLLFAQTTVINHSPDTKYSKWMSPGYFKGYNALYDAPKTFRDFLDFKNYGGNMIQIGVFGFMKENAPYTIQQNNIDSTDAMVNYCRQAGIYYVIAVRSGPGAYDTYQESQGNTGESRIWNAGNMSEQQLYADMLNMIVTRYSGDTLFAGINLVVEPRPKVKSIPANSSGLYKYFLESVYNIHMDSVYNFLINQIRQNDAFLPVIIENFGYSTPELFPPYELHDPYIIYSAHNYMPKEYTNASSQFTKVYPGTYWNLTYLSQQYYDSVFIRNVIFGKLRNFQLESGGKPIFIGEFGIMFPQAGSNIYLNDILSICREFGWHFALWDWRRGAGKEWNIEKFEDDSLAINGLSSWETVLSYFYAPPVPKIISPTTYEIVRTPVLYKWDSLTSFTMYDIEVYNDSGLILTDSNIINSSYYDTLTFYQQGRHYYWKVRAKNPGGKNENCSSWTGLEDIYIPAITDKDNPVRDKFILFGNYPNPFNPATTIKYYLPKNSFLTLKVYDLLGRTVVVLVNENQEKGIHNIQFNCGNLASGVYIYRITAAENNNIIYNDVKRMILLK